MGSSAGFTTVPGAGTGSRSKTAAVSGANSSHAARETPASVSAAAISATRFFSPSRIRTRAIGPECKQPELVTLPVAVLHEFVRDQVFQCNSETIPRGATELSLNANG